MKDARVEVLALLLIGVCLLSGCPLTDNDNGTGEVFCATKMLDNPDNRTVQVIFDADLVVEKHELPADFEEYGGWTGDQFEFTIDSSPWVGGGMTVRATSNENELATACTFEHEQSPGCYATYNECASGGTLRLNPPSNGMDPSGEFDLTFPSGLTITSKFRLGPINPIPDAGRI